LVLLLVFYGELLRARNIITSSPCLIGESWGVVVRALKGSQGVKNLLGVHKKIKVKLLQPG
jgi:hypothetical protein